MLKRFAVAVLTAAAGVLGSIIGSMLFEINRSGHKASDSIYFVSLPGAAAGALLMSLFLALLESERALSWNWRWHRFWYLVELVRNPDLRHWQTDFARLHAARSARSFSAVQVSVGAERQDLLEALDYALAPSRQGARRILVAGEPGSGKTTGLERFTHQLAKRGIRRLGFRSTMPVLVRLGGFTGDSLIRYAADCLKLSTRGKCGDVLSKGLERLVERGCVVLLLDALDEALGTRRDRVFAELDALLKSQRYKFVPVVITSRTREVPWVSLDVDVLEIQELSDDSVATFISAYKSDHAHDRHLWRRLEDHQLLDSGALGRNPFWLRLIVETGVFAGNKGLVLNSAVDTLLASEWDQKPTTDRSWKRVLPRDEQLAETKLGLAYLAARMSEEDQVTFPQQRALQDLSVHLASRIGMTQLRPQDVLGLAQDAKLLDYQAPDNFGALLPARFRHRLLQEFLTAVASMANLAGFSTEVLVERSRDFGWWQTLVLLACIENTRSELIVEALVERGKLRDVLLALGILASLGSHHQTKCESVVKDFEMRLREPITEEHILATIQVWRVAGEPFIGVLSSVLNSNIDFVPQHALRLFGHIQSRRAAEMVLLAALRRGTLWKDARRALKQIGAPAVDVVIETLRSMLRRTVSQRPFISAVVNADSRFAGDLCRGLIHVQDRRATGVLCDALRHGDEWVASCAAEALGLRRDVNASFALVQALELRGGPVGSAAAKALARIGRPESIAWRNRRESSAHRAAARVKHFFSESGWKGEKNNETMASRCRLRVWMLAKETIKVVKVAVVLPFALAFFAAISLFSPGLFYWVLRGCLKPICMSAS